MLEIEQQNSIGNTYKTQISLSAINIKNSKYSDYLNAYVKALFYNSKEWIVYLEKNHIKQNDIEKFTKLISKKTYKVRQNYFENKTGRLNSNIKRFIDKYKRFQTTQELYKFGSGL